MNELEKAKAAKAAKRVKSLEYLNHMDYWVEEDCGVELEGIKLVERGGGWLAIITGKSAEGPQISFISGETLLGVLSSLANKAKNKSLEFKLDEKKIKWLQEQN